MRRVDGDSFEQCILLNVPGTLGNLKLLLLQILGCT